jgi:SPP1 gp7 family putative phage head morphogenesis protein
MRKRFTELAIIVKKSIVNNDCFGLNKKDIFSYQLNPASKLAFDFVRSQDKIDAFMQWLKEQQDKGIIDVGVGDQYGSSIENAWTNLYILDSYKRGVDRTRYELKKAGIDVPTIEMSGGIAVIMGLPMHMDRVGLLYTRMFNELKGITLEMDTIISRILAQGMIDGLGPAKLARQLVYAINGTSVGDLALTDSLGRIIPAMRRAMMIARTEIIRAHHLAMVQEYRNWGEFNIIVKGEWKTAGDDRVCEKCADLDGQIFTLDEIENMIPAHPMCRCIALPYVEDMQKYYKK